MTTITATTPSATTHPAVAATHPAVATAVAVAVERTRRFPVLRAGLASGAVAAVATTVVAAVAVAADVPVAVGGEEIPLLGFAQLTLVGALLGVAIARLCGRARHPRRAFVVTTGVLTALSLVPDVTADATTATQAVLILTHLVAAAIVIPVLAARGRR